MSLIITGCIIANPCTGVCEPGDITVDDGIITRVGQSDPAPGDELIKANGLIAAPGLVDLHVHLRDPGQTHKEDIITGCCAAAAGGVTSLVCMPNTSPAIDSPDAVSYVRAKAAQADAHVYVAAAVSKGLRGEQPCDYRALACAGAVALSDDGRPVESDDLLRGALQNGEGLSVLCHCENLSLAAGGKMYDGDVSRTMGVPGIPAEAEWRDVERAVRLAEESGAQIHICHVSTARSLEIIRAAKARGMRVTCETAPHYCAFTDSMLTGRDADFRMNPPLGSEADRKAVLAALRDGTVDAVATDHAPHSPQEKADFMSAPNGVIGMETSLAAMMTCSGLELCDILRLMSYNPAKILGIPAGELRVGMPADVILINPAERWTVVPDELHGKSRNAVFKGCELTGRVKLTMLSGRVVYSTL